MPTSYAHISSNELDQFLTDVHKNVAHDEKTDFKKLLLYLFGFAHAKLSQLATRPTPEASRFVSRIFAAIELVLALKKHVLNLSVHPGELTLILDPAADGLAPTFLILPSSSVLVYDWLVTFAVQWLSRFPADLDLTNIVKSFLHEVIHIVAAHLHGIKYKKFIGALLVLTVSSNVDKLLGYVPYFQLREDFSAVYGPLLSSTIHLFTVANDYDISAKLSLQTSACKFRFDALAKKLSFILTSIDMLALRLEPSDSEFQLIDTSKAVLLLNLTYNILLDNHVRWSLVAFVLNSIHTHCQALQSSKGSPAIHLKRFNKTMCVCLMRIYSFCVEKSLVTNFFHSFLIDEFDLMANPGAPASFPLSVLKTLSLLSFQQSIKYDTPKAGILPTVFFKDAEMQHLADFILHGEDKSVQSELDFHIDPTHSFQTYQLQRLPELAEKVSEIRRWLEYAVQLTKSSQVLNDVAFYSFISACRNVPCIISGDYDFELSLCAHCTTTCSKNVYAHIIFSRKQITELSECMVFYTHIVCEFLLKLNGERIFQESLLTTNLLLSLFHLLATFRLPDRDVKAESLIVKFVILCLISHRNRDARILAARVLPLFFLRDIDGELEALFLHVFQKLSGIQLNSSRETIHLAESTILALSELAIVCEGEWLWVLFIKLIDCLGESNEQHVNIAYNSLLYIASAKKLTPYKLLSPFLPSIAERIIKKPLMLARLTELLGISKKYFLSNTREYTTPRLLEYYKHDFIQDIADACNLGKLKLIAKVLPRIIATYLCKDEKIDSKYILNVLSNASPNYKKVTLMDLIPNVGEVLWFILLQMQMNDDGHIQNEARIHNAIIYIAKINWMKRPENSQILEPPSLDDFDYVQDILQEHVLELAQRFSENILQLNGIKPYLERVSSIKAIRFLISKNPKAASWALGQISSCLQAAISSSSLEVHAFQCWNVLIQKLDSQNLVALFDITISFIFQKFESVCHRSKLIAAEILRKLFREIRQKYIQYGPYYYSYPYIKDMDKYYVPDASTSSMLKLKNNISFFPELSRRLQTGSRIVVHQALDDLINSARSYQQTWQSESLRESTSQTEISELVRTVLDVSVLFKTKDSLISTKCATVLASLGSLDSNRFNFKTIKSQILILHDFSDTRENAKFLVSFIKDIVIKNFWASDDPNRQLYSVYCMQRFLSVMGLDPSVLKGDSQGIRNEIWNSFSEMDKATLTPLLSLRYHAQNPRYEPLEFPHFRLGMKHEKWLIDITTNLFRRPILASSTQKSRGSSTKQVIFLTCSMLIRDDEVSISQYLLKYVALSHIANGDDETLDDIILEFMSVLTNDASISAGSDRVENLKLCYQSIYEVIDYLNEWVSAATQKLSNVSLSKAEALFLTRCRLRVLQFLEQIPQELIASTSSLCDSYERTILYLEKCYRSGQKSSTEALLKLNIRATLQSVYSNIDDYDALNGVLKKFSTANLAEKLTSFQYNENWLIAQESFQVLSDIGTKESRADCNTKLLKSFSDHALFDKALSSLNAKMSSEPVELFPMAWAMVGLLAALVSGEFSEIQKWRTVAGVIGEPQDVEDAVTFNFTDGLLSLALRKPSQFTSKMSALYEILGQALSLSMSSSFSRNTKLLRQLHTVFDASLIASGKSNDSSALREDILLILKERLANSSPEFESQWWILSIHKLCNAMVFPDDNKISSIYLNLSQLARKHKRLDIATKCIMRAMVLNDTQANVEYAHLLWDQGRQTEAIKSLSENLEYGNSRTQSERQLQYAVWLDESSHSSSAVIIEEYTKAYKVHKDWDKPFFDLGTFYSKILESHTETTGVYERHIIRLYLHALTLGTRYIYEALPKLITVWLDFAQKSHHDRESKRRLDQIVTELKRQRVLIPNYVWFTSITQLLSRITHSHQGSVDVVIQIITSVITTYPKHSLWYVLSHEKSKDMVRRERIVKILSTARTNKQLGVSVVNAKELFEILENLAAHKVKRASKKRWLLSDDFGVKDTKKRYDSLVIPVKSNLEIRLPASYSQKGAGEKSGGWHAFPRAASVTFDGFDEEVNIFTSLQMPKQITIRGTDNKPYRLMVKRDDTRKDAKVFEFTNMINRLLSASTSARKRNLVVENYCVIPLAEDMGVIEFVADASTMKSIIQLQNKKSGIILNERKLFQTIDEAQKIFKARNSSEPDAIESLTNVFRKICRDAKPVLHQWFIEQFSDPAIWYLARTGFTRTAAVMSMVGYIIGLGDRHCENILFLKKSGAALHIDFDCLFEKGATLPTPEIVPFRLTQNMTDAMGITGIEGIFRITCEVTGTLVRENESSLMNILETLIYDPLLDWKTLENPQEHLRKVRRKIRGLLDDSEGLPTNIHGQVDILIQQAISEQNLARMYGGWAAYV